MKFIRDPYIHTIIVFLLSFSGFAQADVKLLRQGNKLYEQGKFKDAEMDYRKALEINKESDKGKFNLGTAIYKEKNYNEAAKIFEDLSGKQVDKPTKAKIFHNYGNSLLEGKQYEQSIAAYKNSLLNNPADRDTKYNLEYAKTMLKKQQQQQQQKNKNQDKKDQDKKDQDKKNQDNQNKDQNKSQNQDQNKKISKEDAERMLEALKNHEKKTLDKVKKSKVKVQQAGIEKEW